MPNRNFTETLYTYKNLVFIMLSLLIFLLSNQNGFFWDNVLFASKMGNHLFENGIFNWTIPNSFDPGHPPFLGFLLAIFWKILGQKLWVSHLLMLPFTFGVLVQLSKLVSYFITDKKNQFLAFLLIILDPTLATQFVIVNPEILLIFFFLLALNGLLYQQKKLQFVGLFFLSIVSYRGMMLFAGLFLFDLLYNIGLKKENLKQFIRLKYLLFWFLASLPGIVFVTWRLLTKGWLQTHPDSPWASLWQIASPKIFFKNCIVMIWRYADFGRIFLFIFSIFAFLLYGKKVLASNKNKTLLLLSIASVFFIIVTSLIATNTFGHRYFIMSYISFILLAFLILNNYFNSNKWIYLLIALGLFTGNFWVYPKDISQGWDATLGHIPYHTLRLEAIDYLDENDIPIQEVGTFFPNYHPINTIDFSKDYRSFQKFNTNNKYVLYSNIFNLSDEHLNILEKRYKTLKEFNNFNINITLYTLK